MKTLNLKGAALIFLISIIAGPPASATLQPHVTDWVNLASLPSMRLHAVHYDNAEIIHRQAMVGTVNRTLAGISLGPGKGELSLQLMTNPRGATLQFVFSTPLVDYGKVKSYRILINGEERYRAYSLDPGGGIKQSIFLEVRPGTIRTAVEVQALPDSEAPVIVSLIRAYRGTGDQWRPSLNDLSMRLGLLSPEGLGYQIDAGEMAAIKKTIPNSQFIKPEAAVLVNYCTRSDSQDQQYIGQLATLAQRAHFPLRVRFETDWGGVPKGVPDGLGGTFSDPTYQQIIYSPQNQVIIPSLQKLLGLSYNVHYGLSVPNVWGNTPWMTFNNRHLNEFRADRLKAALKAWQSQCDRLALAGDGSLFPHSLSSGDETIYWADGVDDHGYTAFNHGIPRTHLEADFNPATVAAAAKDGVTLDPKNGLDGHERWWLHQNLARQQQRLVNDMINSLEPDPIIIGGESHRTSRAKLTFDNIYTEPYAMPLYPLKEVTEWHPGLELGSVENACSGGEYWNGAEMLPWLLKEREFGRTALPNLECTGAKSEDELLGCLQAAYATGCRYVTLFNWPYVKDISALLQRFETSIEEPTGVMDSPSSGVAARPLNNPLFRSYAAPAGAFGINRIDLSLAGAPCTIAVSLRDIASDHNFFTITVPVAPTSGWISIYLPTLIPQKPGFTYRVAVEHISGPTPSVRLSPDGSIAVRTLADIAAERARSLIVENWEDAPKLIHRLNTSINWKAQNAYSRYDWNASLRAYANNEPVTAYRLAVRAQQLADPSHYIVKNPGGALTPFPVTIRCQAPTHATITTFSPAQLALRLRSTQSDKVQVIWRGSSRRVRLTPNTTLSIVLAASRRIYRPRRVIRRYHRPVPAFGGRHL